MNHDRPNAQEMDGSVRGIQIISWRRGFMDIMFVFTSAYRVRELEREPRSIGSPPYLTCMRENVALEVGWWKNDPDQELRTFKLYQNAFELRGMVGPICGRRHAIKLNKTSCKCEGR